ncbi:hypothetical protein [Rathayibacter sp. VKM Ac-2630]|uniref:hypothetical protein n=1 Tax=Rathayibacter sp. VKM Ac-2630 TaxID=1938617 RepID=UPI001115692E|nr:hypothetical protein [Rathayibacter sp. VKM Ac-2630]
MEISVDERYVSGHLLTRTWHGAATGVVTAPPGSALFVLQLDAEITISPPEKTAGSDGSVVISAGSSFALAPGQRARMDVRRPSARIEIEAPATGTLSALDPSSFPAARWSNARQEWPHAALISLVNIVLNTDPALPLVDTSRLAVTIHSCLEGFVAHSDAPVAVVTQTGAQSLVRRAREALERRAPDPDFTVEKLASELGVTREYLWRVFTAELSISPRDALRAHRRQAAVDFLEDTRESGDRVDMNALARRTGFGSHHALRRALKASDLKPPR